MVGGATLLAESFGQTYRVGAK